MHKKYSYNVFQNSKYFFSNLWIWEKKVIGLSCLLIPVLVLQPLCNLYLPKIVIDNIENQISTSQIILNILTVSLLILFCNIATKIIIPKINLYSLKNYLKYSEAVNKKIMSINYEQLESSNGQLLYKKAKNSLYDKNRFPDLINSFIYLFVNSLGFVSYAHIISQLNIVFVVLLLFTYGIDGLILLSVRNYEQKLKTRKSESFNRIHKYITKLRDIELSKEIRIYNMFDLIKYVGNTFISSTQKVEKELARKRFLASVKSAVLIILRDGIVYIYLIHQLINSNMSAGDIILYLSAILGFSNWIGGIAEYFDRILTTSHYICDIRNFLEYDDNVSSSFQKDIYPKDQSITIEISDLSFTYPETGKTVLENINLTIKSGEKIAIVGNNGAGKSTLVKLICGLYSPTKGYININGTPVYEYNKETYYNLISVVFQDSSILPISIEENITQTLKKNTNYDKLKTCIKYAGLESKINSLDLGTNAILGKSLNEHAIDLSGGELQKLLLARAIYRDAPILILDEPTASLDPIAEEELYLKYNYISKEKTSIYISHRLASTKFCDRIILLNDSTIAEMGTHNELMELNGLYAKMFKKQSQYYV